MKFKQFAIFITAISLLITPIASFANVAVTTGNDGQGSGNVATKTAAETAAAKKAAEEAKKAKIAAEKKALKDAEALLNAAAITCSKAAMDKREDAIIAAWNAYYPAITTALTTRKSSLNTAWSGTDAKTRIAARKATWTKYYASVNEASAKLKSAKKAARATFDSETKTCKLPVPDESSRADNI